MTSPIGATNGASNSTTTTTTSTAQTPTMDKDAFLKLLVAQISHQDPLKPMEGTEFVTQLAQFSAVEQAVAQTKSLDTLSSQMTGLANAQVTDLVGKTVTVTNADGNDITAAVSSIGYDKGYAELHLADGTTVSIGALKSVQAAPAAATTAATTAAAAALANTTATSNASTSAPAADTTTAAANAASTTTT